MRSHEIPHAESLPITLAPLRCGSYGGLRLVDHEVSAADRSERSPWGEQMNALGFLPVTLSTLVPQANVGLDLYKPDAETAKFILYRSRDVPLGPADIDRLRERGVKQLYIPRASRYRYQEYLREVAESDTGGISFARRVGALNEVVRDVLETSFASEDMDGTVEAVTKLGNMASEIIANHEFAAGDLFRVLYHDYSTFTHVTNVGFYSAILAAELGMGQQELEQITIGGLLHDVGKLEISGKILSKSGRLNEEEFHTIQTHPTVGFHRLSHRLELNQGQLMMVYQHHERIDGKGYPVGAVDQEVHPWAKICAVVDVFEALTSYRPYRSPMSRRQALELQNRDCGTAFDPEILRCWTSIIQRDFAN